MTFKMLFTMWAHPRLVAWFLISTFMMVGIRTAFMATPIIPYYLDFNPGIVLVPLAGAFFGPAGVWGAFASSLLSDWIGGMFSYLSLFKAVGLFLFAFTAQELWVSRLSAAIPRHESKWKPAFRFAFLTIPGCLTAAVCTGIGSEWLSLYPLTYIGSLTAVHHLVLTSILSIALYRVLAREFVPHWGTWWEQLDVPTKRAGLCRSGILLVWTGSVGAFTCSILASGFFCHIWPWQPYVIGSSCGWALPLAALPFLIILIYGLFGCPRKDRQG